MGENAQIESCGLRLKHPGSDSSLEAEIEASRLRLKPGASD